MKKTMLSVIICCVAYAVQGQTEKDDWLIGGTLQFNTSKANSVFQFSPQVGYFIINNFAIGGRFVVDHNKLGDDRTTAIGAGPFARYYFLKAKFRPFVAADMDFSSVKRKTGSTPSSTETAFNYFIGGGGAFFISDNVALETIMGYRYTKVENKESAGGFNFRIGFQVYINRYQADEVKSRLSR